MLERAGGTRLAVRLVEWHTYASAHDPSFASPAAESPAMFFSPRIRLKPLAQLCRRLATATGAGLEDRRIWRTKRERGGASQRAAVAQVSDALARGESIGDALADDGRLFPAAVSPDRRASAIAQRPARPHLPPAGRALRAHARRAADAARARSRGRPFNSASRSLTIGVVIWISSALNLKNARRRAARHVRPGPDRHPAG